MVSDIAKIVALLDQAGCFYLCDTVAVSQFELAYHRHQKNLLGMFVRPDDLIILTDTITAETRMAEDKDDRYMTYLRQFPNVICIKESDFLALLQSEYHPQAAKKKFKALASRVFQYIQPLREQIQRIDEPTTISLCINNLFASRGDKNKGEFMLVWLSALLRELYPPKAISFVGYDRDLYQLVHDFHFRNRHLNEELRMRGDIQIVSTDTLLQGLLKTHHPRDEIIELCGIYRNESRKVLFHHIQNGLRQKALTEGVLPNPVFVERIIQSTVDIVY